MTKKQSAIIAEKIHLIKLDVVKQKIDGIAFKQEKEHKLNVGHKFMFNLDAERVKIELAFSFEDNDKNKLIFFQIDFHFQVEHLSDFYQMKEKAQPVFYASILATLLGISLSTARGIIFEKLQNAGIKNVIIPVVSPHKMLAKSTSR